MQFFVDLKEIKEQEWQSKIFRGIQWKGRIWWETW